MSKMKGKGFTECLFCSEENNLFIGHELVIDIVNKCYKSIEYDIMLQVSKICTKCIGCLQQIYSFTTTKNKPISECTTTQTNEHKKCEFCHQMFLENERIPLDYNVAIYSTIFQTEWANCYDENSEIVCCFGCFLYLNNYCDMKNWLVEAKQSFDVAITQWKVCIHKSDSIKKEATELPTQLPIDKLIMRAKRTKKNADLSRSMSLSDKSPRGRPKRHRPSEIMETSTNIRTTQNNQLPMIVENTTVNSTQNGVQTNTEASSTTENNKTPDIDNNEIPTQLNPTQIPENIETPNTDEVPNAIQMPETSNAPLCEETIIGTQAPNSVQTPNNDILETPDDMPTTTSRGRKRQSRSKSANKSTPDSEIASTRTMRSRGQQQKQATPAVSIQTRVSSEKKEAKKSNRKSRSRSAGHDINDNKIPDKKSTAKKSTAKKSTVKKGSKQSRSRSGSFNIPKRRKIDYSQYDALSDENEHMDSYVSNEPVEIIPLTSEEKENIEQLKKKFNIVECIISLTKIQIKVTKDNVVSSAVKAKPKPKSRSKIKLSRGKKKKSAKSKKAGNKQEYVANIVKEEEQEVEKIDSEALDDTTENTDETISSNIENEKLSENIQSAKNREVSENHNELKKEADIPLVIPEGTLSDVLEISEDYVEFTPDEVEGLTWQSTEIQFLHPKYQSKVIRFPPASSEDNIATLKGVYDDIDNYAESLEEILETTRLVQSNSQHSILSIEELLNEDSLVTL